ncbi:MAG: DUF692 domain-containing protein [Methylococcales bacterium]|nr:DUF692 domain-containing protein [Methylococcales bacterium]
MTCTYPATGAGLGLRRSFLKDIAVTPPASVAFYELAPENWIKTGGALAKNLAALSEQAPLLAHGLSLSVGSCDPLDTTLLCDIKQFLRCHNIRLYSEHLSYSSFGGHVYDLLPLPFTEESVRHVAARVRRIQDYLEQPIALENVSYYLKPPADMTECAFINAVLEEADCLLLLDINNIYVNSHNHGYDAAAFLEQMPGERIAYYHVAGHFQDSPTLIIDTHGAAVIDPVWRLLQQAYSLHGVKPTVLERDFNIPPLTELLAEIDQIHALQTLS